MTGMTNEAVVSLKRRTEARQEHSAQAELVVGKDLLELLSTAMYVDPLTIYREFIQNAADAIDDAYDSGIFSGACDGIVDIQLDPVLREMRIRDNGVGVRAADAKRVLTSFGASNKRVKARRGFRGVGRLAALGCGQFLTFRTKAQGDSRVCEVRWDCRKLKNILLDPSYQGELADVVRDVVRIATLPAADSTDHFFEVHLERTVRIKNDLLLNEEKVCQYLSQIAPAPLRADFPYREEIEQHIGRGLSAPRFRIRVNAKDDHIVRPFGKTFDVTAGKPDAVAGVRCLELKDADGVTLAVGWLADHSYLGAIQRSSDLRGLRARVGDIQVGSDDVFAEIFPESRFNAWTIGELHVVDRRIVPNGRRDNFEQNAAYHQLINELAPIARDIARRCRASSAKRNRIKSFDLRALRAADLLSRVEQGVLRGARRLALLREIGAALGEMEKTLGGELLAEAERKGMARRLDGLRRRLLTAKKWNTKSDPLGFLPHAKRAAYEEIFELIYDCSTNRVAAQSLVDRMTARLAGRRLTHVDASSR